MTQLNFKLTEAGRVIVTLTSGPNTGIRLAATRQEMEAALRELQSVLAEMSYRDAYAAEVANLNTDLAEYHTGLVRAGWECIDARTAPGLDRCYLRGGYCIRVSPRSEDSATVLYLGKVVFESFPDRDASPLRKLQSVLSRMTDTPLNGNPEWPHCQSEWTGGPVFDTFGAFALTSVVEVDPKRRITEDNKSIVYTSRLVHPPKSALPTFERMRNGVPSRISYLHPPMEVRNP